MIVKVMESVLAANESAALRVRGRLAGSGTFMVNLIGSPGAGKTSLLERCVPVLSRQLRLGIIEGDVETIRDAERLSGLGVPIVAVSTKGMCHLDSATIDEALNGLPADLDLVFIENVGNLVCPAEFDLGEAEKTAVVSVTEGHDKPEKYPLLFRLASVVVLNKADLAPYTDFDGAAFRASLSRLNPRSELFEVSCRAGSGLDPWISRILSQAAAFREGRRTKT
jgi:hydrogenase nickel incorporation protein HypB